MATTTNVYSLKEEEDNNNNNNEDMKLIDFNANDDSNQLNVNENPANILENIKNPDDDKLVLIEDLFPPLLAKFMKVVGGVHSYGKGAKVDVIKYLTFWTIANLFFANMLACWMYIAGADAIFSWIISFLYVPVIMTGGMSEINMFKSSYMGAILSREENRKKLRGNLLVGMVMFFITFLGITWALPIFTIILPFIQIDDLPLGLQLGFYTYIYASPIAILVMTLNMQWMEIIPMHQKEVIERIKDATKAISAILSNEKVSGIEGRKLISKVQDIAVKQIHHELIQQGTQITSMMCFLVWIIALNIYLTVAPLDPSRSKTTGAMVIRFLFYFQGVWQLAMSFFYNLKTAATPNNIWHDFTDSIYKDPHLLCLVVSKFDDKLELLNLWVEKNIITFRLFGVSIDRYLPGKMFAGFTSIIISAGFVIGRTSGSF